MEKKEFEQFKDFDETTFEQQQLEEFQQCNDQQEHREMTQSFVQQECSLEEDKDFLDDGKIKGESDINSYPLMRLLPCKIADQTIKKLKWDDFIGEPNPDLPFNAHTFWNIRYDYFLEHQTGENNKKKVIYDIQLYINVLLSDRSWVKNPNNHLLNHEQGHLIIGYLMALQFKQRFQLYEWTANYKNQIQRLFRETLAEFLKMEKRYDRETRHRLNLEKQVMWDCLLIQQINYYQQYFKNSPEINFNKLQTKRQADYSKIKSKINQFYQTNHSIHVSSKKTQKL